MSHNRVGTCALSGLSNPHDTFRAFASLVVLVTGGHSELEPFRDSHEPAMQKIAS